MKQALALLLVAATSLSSCNGDASDEAQPAGAPVASDPAPAPPSASQPAPSADPIPAPPAPPSVPVTPPVTPSNPLDADGVQMLLPSAAGGASLALGTRDPTKTQNFSLDEDMPVTAGTDGAIRFWNTLGYVLQYAEGGSSTSVRFNLNPSGGTQKFNWRNQKGFLSSAADAKNQEFTIFLRAHQLLDADHAQATMKLRGGNHTDRDPDAASCVMMTFAPKEARSRTRFGKELTHPEYDYVTLTRAFEASLVDNQWVGLKVVSFNKGADAKSVVNRLFIDTDPLDRTTGKPKNNWRLFSEYTDVDGKSTGSYTQVVNWGGWINTLRVDGYHDIDIALPSVREIVPPQ